MPKVTVIHKDFGADVPYIRIIPLADLHVGSTGFNENKFLWYRGKIINDPYTFCVINGDVLEFVTKSSKGDVFDSIRPREQRKLAVKYLKPLADEGKIIAYLDGNHEDRAKRENDEYIGEEICANLGIPSVYGEDGIYLFMSVGYDSSEGKKNRIVYTAYMLHGWTGARTVGGKFTNLASMQGIAFADLYIGSHVHQMGVFPLETIVPNVIKKKAQWHRQLFVSTGAFMDYSGYAIRGGYRPTSLGSPMIELDGRVKNIQAVVG